MNLAKLHAAIGFIYLCLGMALGLYMGFSMNTGLVVVHAHWLLIGGVLTTLYGLAFKAFGIGSSGLAFAQFSTHHLGTLIVAAVSPLFYGTNITHAITGPVAGVSSAIVLVGGILMVGLLLEQKEG